jgi:hypothetical protein
VRLEEEYEHWPREDRSYLVFKLLCFAGRLRALYHPEVKDRSDEPLT